MADSLTFAIHPAAETISFGLLLRTIQDVRRLVQDVDYAVTREPRRRWVVTRLRSSTPEITIRPQLDGTDSVNAIGAGLRIVTSAEGVEPPPYFSADALDDLKRMRRLFRGRERAKSIVFKEEEREIATIDERISKQVDRIESGTYWLLGSLEGMLEAVNFHGVNKKFIVWDRVTSLPVRCSLPSGKDWTERVKRMLEERVRVAGQINYYSNGVPRSLVKVGSLERLEGPEGLPEASFGSIPDLTAGKEPSEFLQSMRE